MLKTYFENHELCVKSPSVYSYLWSVRKPSLIFRTLNFLRAERVSLQAELEAANTKAQEAPMEHQASESDLAAKSNLPPPPRPHAPYM